MSDDWNVGDLAVAVGVSRASHPNSWFPGQKADGKIYRVIGLVPGRMLGLIIEGFPPSPHPRGSWHHESFRRVRPDERDACEPEFVTLLKRSKRNQVAEVNQGGSRLPNKRAAEDS